MLTSPEQQLVVHAALGFINQEQVKANVFLATLVLLRHSLG